MTFKLSDVNVQRMLNELQSLSQFGALPEGGITRLTFTSAHQQATKQVAQWMAQANLEVSFDQWGNLYGCLPCEAYQEKAVYTGSHLDSVPGGGNFDGPLGVIASLEAIRMIQEKEGNLKKPIEVVSFIEEEGSRFKMHLGSALAMGLIDNDELMNIKDASGKTFIEEHASLAFPFPVKRRNLRDQIDSYIELHIEQGTRLEKAEKSIGVVTHFAGPRYYRIEIHGRADHAGTTDYEERHDALLAASWLVLESGRLGREKYNQEGRITVGMLQAEPGAANVVAEKVVLTMDTRSISGQVSDAIESDIRRLIDATAEKYRVSIDVEVVLDILPVAVGDDMRAAILEASTQAGVSHMDVISWAAHDAQEIAQYAPAGMLFVPCVEGRSHCPQEFTREEDIAAGTAVLANVLLALAA